MSTERHHCPEGKENVLWDLASQAEMLVVVSYVSDIFEFLLNSEVQGELTSAVIEKYFQ